MYSMCNELYLQHNINTIFTVYRGGLRTVYKPISICGIILVVSLYSFLVKLIWNLKIMTIVNEEEPLSSLESPIRPPHPDHPCPCSVPHPIFILLFLFCFLVIVYSFAGLLRPPPTTNKTNWSPSPSSSLQPHREFGRFLPVGTSYIPPLRIVGTIITSRCWGAVLLRG